jgi:hypothetical protein
MQAVQYTYSKTVKTCAVHGLPRPGVLGLSPLLMAVLEFWGEDLGHFPTGGHLTTPAIQGNHTQDYMVKI